IFDWLQEAAYPSQAIGRPILGPAERVSAFRRDDLADFVRSHYGSDRLIIAAAGAIDHDDLVKRAEDLFGDLKPAPVGLADPASFRTGERREIKGLEQAHIALALESPGYRDKDIYAAQIFSTAFGGGMSSRLFQEIREKRGLCYAIYAQAGAYADTGMTTIYAGTSGDLVGELASLTIDEMKRAADDMTEEEIARARAQLKAGLLMGLESPSARAERLARMVSIWDRVPTLEETVERIDAVDRYKIRDFAGSLLIANTAMALYGPVTHAPEMQELRQRLSA
ncbi:MAG: insulinase family protein, partial [Paracoccaceae bacterium]|nr:insulinase family protein [Paracoccaceae bacterium]